MPRLYQVFKNHKPMLGENNNLVLEVASELQKKDIEDRAFTKIDGFLKKGLKNYDIHLAIKVLATQQKRNLVYTASDKYNYLAEKNENLNKLKQNFSLDLE